MRTQGMDEHEPECGKGRKLGCPPCCCCYCCFLIMTPFAAATTGPATDDVNRLPGSVTAGDVQHFGRCSLLYNSPALYISSVKLDWEVRLREYAALRDLLIFRLAGSAADML